MSRATAVERVERDECSCLRVRLPEGEREIPLARLPETFLDWIDQGRRSTYDTLAGRTTEVPFFSQHLPALITVDAAGPFPFNCSTKGVGYLPRPEALAAATTRYEEVLESTRGRPWEESLALRLEAAARFNFDRSEVDPRCLATLEIFEKTTFRNLHNNPLAALLFTGGGPRYLSYQLNCAVEIVGPEDPRYQFVALSRRLFEYDTFHITQPQYRYAYIFWVSEVLEKTPHRVARIEPVETDGALPWDDAALQAIGVIPALVRGRVQQLVEEYAGERGFARVTPAVLHEARRAMRC